MKILSLYDGVSCGRVALERAGIAVERYVAFENDKFAIEVSSRNYPDIEHRGEINADTDFSEFSGFDMVIGGSPCTYWSIAKQNRETTCEGIGFELFMHFVRAVRQTGCKWFLYENNHSIHADIKAEITRELGVEHIMINSALVSAQRRKRCYWTNIPNVQQPEDKGILLCDILESGVTDRMKSYCVDAHFANGGNLKGYLGKGRRQQVFEPIEFPYRKNTDIIITEKGIRCQWRDKKKSTAAETKVMFVNGKADNLITAHIPKIIEPVRLGHYGKGGQGQRIYSVREKSVSIKSTSGGAGSATGLYKIDLSDGDYIIRKLTPVECERLQTLPDNYTAGVSNTQRYRQIGNGWTVDVIANILSYIPAAELARRPPLPFRHFNPATQQLTLF